MVKRTLSICVFCGSSHGAHPRYADAARRLGTLIAAHGYSLVFGGGGIGLMGEVARAVGENGANVIGVLPQFLRHLEPPSRSTEELIITTDMQERKARMLSLSDAFVILPGGLGTLDEVFEVITTAQLKVHAKPIIFIDTEGFFAPTIAAIEHAVRQGFAAETATKLYSVVATPEEAIEIVTSALRVGADR